jgi:hypothetical protein
MIRREPTRAQCQLVYIARRRVLTGGLMGRLVVFILIGALLAGVVLRGVIRKRRIHKETTPELNKHPERLDQMLDPTDDA